MENGRSETIRALYGAASGIQPWACALRKLAEYTDSRCVTLDTYDLEAHRGEILVSSIDPHPAIEDDNRIYRQGNPLIETVYSSSRNRQLFRASHFFPMREFKQTQLFNSVYHPLGIGFVAGVPVELEKARWVTQFSLIKPSGADDFSDKELQRLRELIPHLEQAWAGYRHLSQLESSLETLTSLWDACGHAVMVIDDQLKVHFANRAAEDIFAEPSGLRCHHGTLKLATTAQEAKFRQQARQVTNGSTQIFSFAQPDAAEPNGLRATLFRLPDGQIALVITEPTRSSTDFQHGLRQHFNMTPSEAKLVNALIVGDSLRDFADSRQVCYETARTHLKNAMAKNGWRRQTQMISSVLAALLPSGTFGFES